jgi:hypothetical protein
MFASIALLGGGRIIKADGRIPKGFGHFAFVVLPLCLVRGKPFAQLCEMALSVAAAHH